MSAKPLEDAEIFVYGRLEAQIFLPHQLDAGRTFDFQVNGRTAISLVSGLKDGAYLGRITMMVTVPIRGSVKFKTEKELGYQLDFPVFLNRRIKARTPPADCNGTVLRRPPVWGGGNWSIGKCYSISGVVFQWISPTQALLGPDKDHPLLVEYSKPPDVRLGLNPTIAIDEGTEVHTNEFGISNPIPRLKALGTE
ncbi:MAG TPA: hypothetical protein VJN94_08740 [Candidatus Binataceae bacterium]|nr:hypothetical protein [Candidatus Binataceae bacterium]